MGEEYIFALPRYAHFCRRLAPTHFAMLLLPLLPASLRREDAC